MEASQVSQEYLFILSHKDLSLAELITYFEDREVDARIIGQSRDTVAMNISRFNSNLVMKHLGGSYKMAIIIGKIPLLKTLNIDNLTRIFYSFGSYRDIGNKVNWGISLYTMEPKMGKKLLFLLEKYFRQRLELNGIRKVKYIQPRRPILSNQKKEFSQEILSEEVEARGMIQNGFEVIASALDNVIYFGRTVAVVDHKGFKERDFGRPVQRSILSIPPKLARILVNLAGGKTGQIVLDPFCGIGTILAEALIMRMDVRGIDIDTRRVLETSRNLEWVVKRYSISVRTVKEKVLQGNSERLSSYFEERSIDSIATEPILLPPLRRYPFYKETLRMLSRAEKVYSVALVEMARVLKRSGRIAIVIPYIQTRDRGLISFPVNDILKNAGLKPYVPRIGILWKYPLFAKVEDGQKVIRGIYVLKKG